MGAGERKVEEGNETVLFRHEKTFYHQPGIFYRLRDDEPDEAFAAKLAQISAYKVERVGITMRVDGVAVQNSSGDAAKFARSRHQGRGGGDAGDPR